MTQHPARIGSRVAMWWWPPAFLLFVVLAWRASVHFLRNHAFDPLLPPSIAPDGGWWAWTDQSRYYRAAVAWASGNLDPSQHWYLPGYPLLAAPFVRLTPADPFLLPDLGCFLLSFWLMICLGRRMFSGDVPSDGILSVGILGALCGAAAFWIADVRSIWGLAAWIEPWTSTPLTPLLLGLLLATLRFGDRPRPERAVLCGLLWGAVVIVRPTEAVTAGLPAVLFCALVCLDLRRRPGDLAVVAAGGLAGAAAFCLLAVVLHVSIFGWRESEYMRQSFGTGFEFSALPLKWVILALDPAPLHGGSPGLAFRFPWVLPGFAGILAGWWIAARRPGQAGLRTHLLVGGAVVLHWAMYLCYRDLHPEGLWRYGNYHYFKWTEAVLAFYAIRLVLFLFGAATRERALIAATVVALAACWRVVPQPLPAPQQDARVVGPHVIAIPAGLRHPDRALLVSGSDDFDATFLGPQHLKQAGRIWAYNGDFKAWPIPGGFALAALRHLPRGTAQIRLDPRLTLGPATCLEEVRMRIVFALPGDVDRPASLIPAGSGGCRR